jgi:hypothetical protein
MPAIHGNPTRWHVTMESSMSTLSKAAVASKSDRTPRVKLWRDRSKNNVLFRTALLHVCPGMAYCDSLRSLLFDACLIRR